MKPPEMSSPKKNPITNQDSNKIIKERVTIIPPLLVKYPNES